MTTVRHQVGLPAGTRRRCWRPSRPVGLASRRPWPPTLRSWPPGRRSCWPGTPAGRPLPCRALPPGPSGGRALRQMLRGGRRTGTAAGPSAGCRTVGRRPLR
eukprot:scaffold136283_cov50-Prasinocladus_malaysianus.AAC.2